MLQLIDAITIAAQLNAKANRNRVGTQVKCDKLVQKTTKELNEKMHNITSNNVFGCCCNNECIVNCFSESFALGSSSAEALFSSSKHVTKLKLFQTCNSISAVKIVNNEHTSHTKPNHSESLN